MNDNNITLHVSSCSDFLNVSEPQIVTIADAFELLNISFKQIYLIEIS